MPKSKCSLRSKPSSSLLNHPFHFSHNPYIYSSLHHLSLSTHSHSYASAFFFSISLRMWHTLSSPFFTLMSSSMAVGAMFHKLTSDHASVVSMNIFVALLSACIIIGHLLEENRWINESITALLIVRFLFVFCFLFL